MVGVRHSKEAGGAVLRFTPDEWHAFLGGVRNGEFDNFGKLSVAKSEPSGRCRRLAAAETPGERSLRSVIGGTFAIAVACGA
jgi:hypothetical protein